MVAKPIAGYASKREAIWAMLDKGMSNREIADACDTSEQAVYIEVGQKRKHDAKMLPLDQKLKAIRIYSAALGVIGEALGIAPDTLHFAYARLNYADLSLPTVVRGLGAEEITHEPSDAGISDEQTPENGTGGNHLPDHLSVVPNMVGGTLYTLRNARTGEWLSKSGKATTRYKDIAYRGTLEQAQAAQAASALAQGMKVVRI